MRNLLHDLLRTMAQAVNIWASRSHAADPTRDATMRAPW